MAHLRTAKARSANADTATAAVTAVTPHERPLHGSPASSSSGYGVGVPQADQHGSVPAPRVKAYQRRPDSIEGSSERVMLDKDEGTTSAAHAPRRCGGGSRQRLQVTAALYLPYAGRRPSRKGSGSGGVQAPVHERLYAQRKGDSEPLSLPSSSPPRHPHPPPRRPCSSQQRQCSGRRPLFPRHPTPEGPALEHKERLQARGWESPAPLQPSLVGGPVSSNRYYASARPSCSTNGLHDAQTATEVGEAAAGGADGDAGGVVVRLTSVGHSGQTSTGRRVLYWSAAAGLEMEPQPRSRYQVCCAFGRDPRTHARAWRELCSRSRAFFARRSAQTMAGGGKTARSADASFLSGLSDERQPRRRRHPPGGGEEDTAEEEEEEEGSDGEGRAARGQKGRAGRHMAFRRRRPGEALCEYRGRLEHARWCVWQLRRFYEQGAKYLSSVWKQVGRGELSFLFTGRFVVPTEARIREEVRRYERERRKLFFLRRMLLEEYGLGPIDRSDGVRRNCHPKDRDDDDAASTASTVTTDREEGESKGLMHTQAKRVSEALLLQEPFVDVALNGETGLLDMAVYVNGSEDGEGATFLSRSSAGCLDNYRWYVLDGMWKGRVVFFVPRRPSLNLCLHHRRGPTPAEEESPPAGQWRASTAGETVEDVQFMMVGGVCLEKLRTADHQAAASDANDWYMCCRCGQTRRRGRASENGGGARSTASRRGNGFFFCRVCCRRSAHVLVTPDYVRLKERLGRWVTARGPDNKPSPSEVEEWLANNRSAGAAAVASGRRRRPDWVGRTHVDANSFLGYVPPLAAAPLTVG